MEKFENIVYGQIKEICGTMSKNNQRKFSCVKIPKDLQTIQKLKKSARKHFKQLQKAKNPDIARIKSAYKKLMTLVKIQREYTRIHSNFEEEKSAFYERKKFLRDPINFQIIYFLLEKKMMYVLVRNWQINIIKTLIQI